MTQHTSRRKLAVLAAAPLVFALAACASSPASSSNDTASPTVVTVIDGQQSEPGNTQLQKTLEECAAPLNITIKRETVPPSSLVQKLLQKASSHSMPDLLNIDNPDMAEFASVGALTPLKDVGVDTSGYYPGMIGAGTFEKKVYGIPQSGNTLVLSYNKDLLDAAGVTPPKTWDELRAAAKKLTKGDTYGFAMSAVASYEGTWQFMPFMWSNGGDETNINSPETVEALQFVVDLVKDGSLSKSSVNWGQGDALDQFIAGKAAMVENGIWSFAQLDSTKGLNYGTVTFPVPSAGDKAIVPLGGKVWTVPATGDTKTEKAAGKILECLNNEKNQTFAASQGGAVPSKIAIADAFAKDTNNPHNQISRDAVANSRARAAKLGADWPATAKAIYEAEQSAITGQASPADALKSAAGELK